MTESQVPSQSLAAVVENFNQPLVFKTLNIPDLKPFQILVRLEVSGVCHTDLHVQSGDWKVKAKLPIVPGHEGVGYIIKKGESVRNINLGDRVCIPWLHKSCQNCEYCDSNWQTLCPKQEQTGFSENGTFQQYAVAEADFVCVVPEGLTSAQAAPITCAGLTVYKALKISGATQGQYVTIIGAAGGLGHLAVQYAKFMNFRIIGIDLGKNNFLESIGCDYSIDAKEEDVTSRIIEITEIGTHTAICLAPSKASMKQAISYLRPNGSLVIVSLPSGDVELNVFDVVLKGIKIIGSIVGTTNDLREALRIAASGAISCHVDLLKFSQLNEALSGLKEGSVQGRVAVEF